ncbi:MAG: hypothetical protein COU31_05130 [Candidatus Magasanikbacteria bacterium CG10_big_fil_rev_8_21_14_0_10_40_10]|uniref:ABC transporter substrate-binding protein n=1 Tax=Candidatus Magasanikbacteria bacterium CG10_big_fil_rev_8_21_14_0_10_40_10 TaxID=1974648 RepID=A0A2M6W2U8_9BACT|nr:MAG: hypothetical protein COU31_05130 [Candidatus Magasanikbacteria bacterium CG10_big_fil_rev_8_21_14_0_10_40_10]
MKKIKVKLVGLILLVMLTTVGGFGCKGLSAQEQAATKPVVLEFWTVADDVAEMQKLVALYKAERPYLTVNFTVVRENEMYQKLINALADDNSPDILSVRNRSMGAYLNRLAPMPSTVSDVTVRTVKKQFSTETQVNMGTINMLSVDQLDSEYVQTVKKDAVYGGKIYGLPLSIDTMALYYNKDLLDRARVAQPPTNWTDFQTAVKKATRYDSTGKLITQAGTAMGLGSNVEGFDDLLYILFKQSNLSFVDSSGRAAFNYVSSDRDQISSAMSIINFYSDFANAGKDTYTWNSSLDSSLNEFINGRLAFFFGYSYQYSLITSRAPQLNVKILPMLQLDSKQPVNTANYYLQTVSKKSNHQSEAWALINFMADSQATKTYLDATGRPSALRAFIADQQSKKELAPFVSQILVADNWYRGKSYQTAKSALSYMLDQWPKAPTDDAGKRVKYWQDLLNYAAAQVNQSL